VLQGGAGIEWHLRDSDSARPSRRASNRNYNGQTGAVQGYVSCARGGAGSLRQESKAAGTPASGSIALVKKKGAAL
jgi:hypothetical protein